MTFQNSSLYSQTKEVKLEGEEEICCGCLWDAAFSSGFLGSSGLAFINVPGAEDGTPKKHPGEAARGSMRSFGE